MLLHLFGTTVSPCQVRPVDRLDSTTLFSDVDRANRNCNSPARIICIVLLIEGVCERLFDMI